MKITIFPTHFIVYFSVLWFTDKKLIYGLFFAFHHKAHEDVELKIETPCIRRSVSNKKKLIILRFSLPW